MPAFTASSVVSAQRQSAGSRSGADEFPNGVFGAMVAGGLEFAGAGVGFGKLANYYAEQARKRRINAEAVDKWDADIEAKRPARVAARRAGIRRVKVTGFPNGFLKIGKLRTDRETD